MPSPELIAARRAVTEHALLSRPLTADEARCFMEHHVFAVWDFMSVLKRLQRDVTCTTLPWRPPANRRFARLLNEIVLGEETDEDGLGGHCSHFELYVAAMREVGADTRPIEQFLAALDRGVVALEHAPSVSRRFVERTLRLALDPASPTAAIAASFFHGREAIMPEMFRRLLVAVESAGGGTSRLRYYLARHVEVDGDTHGPMAAALLDEMTTDADTAALVDRAAIDALVERRALWDGVLAVLEARARAAQGESATSSSHD